MSIRSSSASSIAGDRSRASTEYFTCEDDGGSIDRTASCGSSDFWSLPGDDDDGVDDGDDTEVEEDLAEGREEEVNGFHGSELTLSSPVPRDDQAATEESDERQRGGENTSSRTSCSREEEDLDETLRDEAEGEDDPGGQDEDELLLLLEHTPNVNVEASPNPSLRFPPPETMAAAEVTKEEEAAATAVATAPQEDDAIEKVRIEDDDKDSYRDPWADDEEVDPYAPPPELVDPEPWTNLLVVGPLQTTKDKVKTLRAHLLCAWLASVALFTAADTALHFSSSGGGDGATKATNADRWFALGARSTLQTVLGLAACALSKRAPWGPRGKQLHLLMVAFFSAYLVAGLDLASRRVSNELEVTCQLMVPLAAVVFALTLSMEAFQFLHLIAVFCLTLSGLLLTQSQLFGAWRHARAAAPFPPVFNFDVTFGLPVGSAPLRLEDNVYEQCLRQQQRVSSACSPDLLGLVAVVLAPVASVYLCVLVCICHEVHVAVVAVWMGLGSMAFTVYGILSTSDISVVLSAPSSSSTALSVVSAFLGSLACLIFLCVVQRAGVVRALALRQLEVALVLALRLWVLGGGADHGGRGERPFALSDLAGMVLAVIGVSVVVVETTFF